MIFDDEDMEYKKFLYGSKERMKKYQPETKKYVYCGRCKLAEKIPGKQWWERQYKCTKYNMICYSNNFCKAGVKKNEESGK